MIRDHGPPQLEIIDTTTASRLQGMPRRRSSWEASSYNEKYRAGTRLGISSGSSSPELSRSSSSSEDRFKGDSEDNHRQRRDCKKSFRSDVISSAGRYTRVCKVYLRSLFRCKTRSSVVLYKMGSFCIASCVQLSVLTAYHGT